MSRQTASEAGGRSSVELGIGPDDVAVLSVARLSPEKGLDTLVRAAAAAADPRLVVMVVGSGPEQLRLQELARSLRIRLLLLGERPWERMVEVYASADVFACSPYVSRGVSS